MAQGELTQMKDLYAGFVHPTRRKQEERLANQQTAKGPDSHNIRQQVARGTAQRSNLAYAS